MTSATSSRPNARVKRATISAIATAIAMDRVIGGQLKASSGTSVRHGEHDSRHYAIEEICRCMVGDRHDLVVALPDLRFRHDYAKQQLDQRSGQKQHNDFGRYQHPTARRDLMLDDIGSGRHLVGNRHRRVGDHLDMTARVADELRQCRHFCGLGLCGCRRGFHLRRHPLFHLRRLH